MGNRRKKRIDSECFRLVDRFGQVRARLEYLDRPYGAALGFFNGAGKRQARLEVRDFGFAALTLFDESGMPRLRAGVDPNGSPELSLRGEDGGELAALTVQAGDIVSLAFCNGDRRTQLRLVLDGEVPSVVLSDPSGQHRVLLKVQPDGRAGVGFFGERGDGHIVVGVDDGDPQIVVHDKAGVRGAMTASVVDGRLRFEES